MLRDL
jgi:DNA replication licensing factor MCM5